MKMKKKIIICTILIQILFLPILYTDVFAAGAGGATGGAISGILDGAEEIEGGAIIDPENYEPDSTSSAVNANKVMNIANDIIGFIQIIGSILSVIVLVVVGIKYMVGSAEERAEYKKTLMPYVIGAIMVFGITNILAIIVNVSGSLL